jgi:hypothetical protein
MFINNRQHLCQCQTFQSDNTVIINTSQADQFDEAAGAFDADLRGDKFFSDFLFACSSGNGAILFQNFPGVLAVLTNALNRDTYGNFAIFNNLLNIMVSSGEGQ